MDIQLPLQPKQKELLRRMRESPATKHGFGGAFGSAKSHGIRACCLIRSGESPGRRLIMRRKKKELIENHIEPLFKQYPFMRKWYNQQLNTLTLSNGSAIVFGYAEHPAKNERGSIYDFQGSEWDDIFIDEASHFNEEELTFMSLRCRATNQDYIPKNVWAMNPGNIGHNFIRRVMIDRTYLPGEKKEEYDFLQAFGWDNVEWVRGELEKDGLDVAAYYALSDSDRFKWFTERSAYGRVLNGLRGNIRLARLMGDWGAFKDQFFDVWNEDNHVMRHEEIMKLIEANPWWPKWISWDWGFEHDSDIQWHAQCGDGSILTYRELTDNHKSPATLATEVLRLTPSDEKIQDVVISWDAMSTRWKKTPYTINQLVDEVFAKSGRMPYCRVAENERVSGWMLLYEQLESERWKISSQCAKLIETIPGLLKDPDKPEDVLKVDGDDSADSARYGLRSRLQPVGPPRDIRVKQRVESWAESHRTTVEDMDPTTLASLSRRALFAERRNRRPTRFRPGRRLGSVN